MLRETRRFAVGALAFAAILAQTLGAQAEEPPGAPDLVFVADPDFGMEGGVRTSLSLGRVLRRYEDRLPSFPKAPFVLRAAANLARFVFLDLPLADTESIFVHEVMGHGARARELGRSPSFSFKLPQPYRSLFSPGDDEVSFSRRRDGATSDGDANTAVVIGGLEANYAAAFWTNAQIVASGGALHVMDALVYSASKLSYANGFLGENLASRDVEAGDDLDAYVADVANRFNRFNDADRRSVARKVQTAYIWNLADPTLLWSAWASLRAIGGSRVTTMPLPTAFGHFVFLSPRFALSPFGAEHYVDLFVSPEKTTHGQRWVGDAYVRVGSSGLASYVGTGVKVLEVPVAERVRVGGELDVWSQPIVDRSVRAYYDRPNTAGVNGAVFAALRVYGPLSITGKLGYKSDGFVMGLPLGDGPHGYVGFAIRP